jgi:hypothetical protein
MPLGHVTRFRHFQSHRNFCGSVNSHRSVPTISRRPSKMRWLQSQVNTNVADSLHSRTLQIGANSQAAPVELLQFSDGRVNIELTDVTDN